jgi:hypothetical protein
VLYLGHLMSSVDLGAHTIVPITLQGDTMLMPVTLNPHPAGPSHGGPWGQQHDAEPRPPCMHGRLGASRCPSLEPALGGKPLSIPMARVSSLAMGALAVEDLDVGISGLPSCARGRWGVGRGCTQLFSPDS